MPDVVPGDATYEESIQRIAQIIQADEHELGAIANLSTESFREWLNDVVVRIARSLGVAVANAHALIADVFTIGVNAASSFARSYREGYARARRIQRF